MKHINSPNNISYKWNNSVMKASDITAFTLKFGRCPIVYIEFENNKIITYNRINSKDSTKPFPKKIFDEKVIELSQNEINKIYKYLNKINFEKWYTDDTILNNYISGAMGFWVQNSFYCKFKNNSAFECLNPKGIRYKMLISFLKKLCKLKFLMHKIRRQKGD